MKLLAPLLEILERRFLEVLVVVTLGLVLGFARFVARELGHIEGTVDVIRMQTEAEETQLGLLVEIERIRLVTETELLRQQQDTARVRDANGGAL